MNERIKQLAIKARLSYVMTPDKPYIEEDLEKFAELIVRGCAGLCDINDKEQGNILREHFGVEE